MHEQDTADHEKVGEGMRKLARTDADDDDDDGQLEGDFVLQPDISSASLLSPSSCF